MEKKAGKKSRAELLAEIESLREKVERFQSEGAAEAASLSFPKMRERLFHSTVHLSPVAVFLHRDLKFIYANPAALKLFQANDLRELQKVSALDIVHPDDRASVKIRIDHIIQTGIPSTIMAHKYIDLKGNVVHVEAFGALIDSEEQPTLLSICNDVTSRKKAEQALSESERRLYEIIDFLPDPAFAIDTQGRVIVWNRAIEEMTGTPKEKVVEKGDYSYSRAFYGEKCTMLIDLAFGNDIETEKRYDFVKREGNAVLAEVYDPRVNKGRGAHMWGKASPLLDSKGNIWGAIEIIRDITERKKNEEALRESETNFRLLTDNAPIAIFVQTGGCFRYLNQAAVRLFGADSQDELLGKPVLTRDPLFHRPTLERENSQDTMAEEGKVLPETERTYLKIDGSPVYVAVSAVPFKFDGVQGVLSLARDITKRKKAEQALSASEMRFQTLINSSPDGVVLSDLDGRIINVNQGFLSILGYSLDEVAGHHCTEIAPSQYHQPIQEAIESFREGKIRKSPFEIEFIKRNGSTIYLQLLIWLISDEADTPIALGAFVRDMTQEKRLAEEREMLDSQLQQAQKMEAIGTLAGGIAHDFNNILSIIIGNADMLEFSNAVAADSRESLSHIISASHRARDLVRQILAFSRREKPKRMTINLKNLVKETVDFLRSTLPSTIKLQYSYEQDTGSIMADPTQIQQVLMNLCTNAAQAMEGDSGTLDIKLAKAAISETDVEFYDAAEPGDFVCLTVSDTGPGIEPAVLQRIFEPYFTTKDKGKGTGLGLSVVHGIVRSHGGIIKIYSEVGRGTNFQVFLPSTDIVAKPAVNVPKELPSGTERILFVDDEPPLAEIGKQILSRLGYQVEIRTSPIEALEAFRVNPQRFDMVITDLTMPQMTGLKLARRLIEIRKDVPIILCTGFSDIETEEAVRSIGIRAVEYKPILMRELSATVRKVLDDQ